MKRQLPISALLCLCLSYAGQAQRFAVQSLNNLAATSINMDLVPQKDNLLNLGSESRRWKQLNLYRLVFADGTVQQTAATPYAAGAGIAINGRTIVNTAPDKLVSLQAGEGIRITGRYPSFTISSTQTNSLWSSDGTYVFCNTANIGIGTNTPAARLHVAGGDAIINGVNIGLGGANNMSNLSIGQQALNGNTTGFSNSVYGNQAMYSNNIGYDNGAFGDHALYSNIDGVQNTALGNGTLYYNLSGVGNTAVGTGALLNNGVEQNVFEQQASYNVATGLMSLVNNTSGSLNTAIGTGSNGSNITGSYNTTVGAFADVAAEDLSNAAAIGANALVNTSNKIRLGDVNVHLIESSTGSFTTSDGRFKTNVREAVPGLDFIKLLRPVVYNFDAAKFDAFLSQRLPDSIRVRRSKALKAHTLKSAAAGLQTGFIAQEVAAAAKQAGYDFNGVHEPESVYDNYSISYEKMVVPLVKSVQELSAQNELLRQQLTELQQVVASLTKANLQTVSPAGIQLLQNVPNPFRGVTTIAYQLPLNLRSAELRIVDASGKLVNQSVINSKGAGQVQFNSSHLANGTYQYQLWVNGAAAATKQMIIIR